MFRCEVCGRKLGIREVLPKLFRRRETTYPMANIDGSRSEQPVRWICDRCGRRARRRRDEGQVGGAESAAPED